MRVLYFAQASDVTGCREEDWKVDRDLTLEEFWAEALRRHPALAELAGQSRVASGMRYVTDNQYLDRLEEAAIIPPVSGG
ncbi:MAG: MoaD/ThiS family protein [Chthoniobacterales bacterium]|nr:MoaD/ThiS family protein [Chthoniobacterales bacterium]